MSTLYCTKPHNRATGIGILEVCLPTHVALRMFIIQVLASQLHFRSGQFAFPKFIKKTGAELVSNGIMGQNLGTKQKKTSQIQPHNAIVDKFGTSLSLNFGKTNKNAELAVPRAIILASKLHKNRETRCTTEWPSLETNLEHTSKIHSLIM